MGILNGMGAMIRAMFSQPRERQLSPVVRWHAAYHARSLEELTAASRARLPRDYYLPIRTGVEEDYSQYVREVYLDGELAKEVVRFDILAGSVVQIKHPFNGSTVEHTTRYGTVRVRFDIEGQSVWLEGE